MTFDTTKQIVTLTTACLGSSTSEQACVDAAAGSGIWAICGSTNEASCVASGSHDGFDGCAAVMNGWEMTKNQSM